MPEIPQVRDFTQGDFVTVMRAGTTASWEGQIYEWDSDGISLIIDKPTTGQVLMFLPWAAGILVARKGL